MFRSMLAAACLHRWSVVSTSFRAGGDCGTCLHPGGGKMGLRWAEMQPWSLITHPRACSMAQQGSSLRAEGEGWGGRSHKTPTRRW